MIALNPLLFPMAKTWIWISGWAICPERFKCDVEQALPNSFHEVLPPTPDALQTVLNGNAGCIGGYSLGSLILLSALTKIPGTTKIICLAPFVSFCREDGLGGTTPRATLESLQKRLRKQPQKTLQLFYRLAGLDETPGTNLPYSIEDLEWGLEQLATLRADVAHLDRVVAISGLSDSLINSDEMQTAWPGCQFSDACNHDYRKLLTRLKAYEASN